VDRDADLLQVVDALGTSGGFSRRLHGGQQKGDQNRDDGDHHQQFDQGEPSVNTDGSGGSRLDGTMIH
jgi:hypothetical protein